MDINKIINHDERKNHEINGINISSKNQLKKKKIVFILIDGLADVSLSDYKDQTPLQHATTPNMDAIACGGLNGLLDPVEPGLACGSDTAHMSILGYDPRKYYRGRGSFEALGAGMHMSPGDVAFKCNFATIEKKENGENIVILRRVDRDFSSWGIDLCNYLDETELPSYPDIKVKVKYATEHRCGVVISGNGLSDQVSGTDPLKDNLPLQISKPFDDSETALLSSKIINHVADVFHEKLKQHPINKARREKGLVEANMVLLRGPGQRIAVETFPSLHQLKSFMIAPTCIIAGLGISLGIDVISVPGATGDYNTNLSAKGKAAVKAFEKSDEDGNTPDFGFVHIKAVDDAGHDNDVQKKIYFLEKIDEMIGELVKDLSELQIRSGDKFAIAITGDHTTPVFYGDHTFEPVPFVIADIDNVKHTTFPVTKRFKTDKKNSSLIDLVQKFSEIDAHAGNLGRFPGLEVMEIVKSFISI